MAVGDLLDGGCDNSNGGGGSGDFLDLTVGDLLDCGSDDGNRSRSDLLDLAVGDLVDDWNDSRSSGRLLELTVANLSGEGRGNKGQGEDDLLHGRHCERDDGINEVWRIYVEDVSNYLVEANVLIVNRSEATVVVDVDEK